MVKRTTELKQLEQIYRKTGNTLTVVYGGRGCGKEELIRAFAADKKSFYYRGRNASLQEQLRQMQKEVTAHYRVTLTRDSYDECFNRLKSGDASKLVVVIDEFDKIVKKDAAFFESIVKLKAKRLYPGPVMILLCSSSISWVERESAACLGEHYKKIDAFMKLEDLSFLDVVRAFPGYTVPQCVETYGILGGIPRYLDRWDRTKSTKENICSCILSPAGGLFGEAEDYIRNQLRELSVYDTILASVASGNEKLNDLYADTGYSRAKLSVYMKNLMAFDVMEKVISFETGGWENTKKGVYRIHSHYVNFWFTFVYPNLSRLYMMEPSEFYETYIASSLDAYLHRYFVDVCREYLELLNRVGRVPLPLVRMGTWIGKEGTIDIIGQSSNRESVVGICNWSQPAFTAERYRGLLHNMKKAKITAKIVYLFSATTFERELEELAAEDASLVLVDMTEL